VNRRTSQKDAKAIVEKVDKNRNGYIDKSEFVAMMMPKLKEEYLASQKNIADLKRMFKQADIDHSGFLTADELSSVLLKNSVQLTQPQLSELMLEMDTDCNGKIDIDEFVDFMSLAEYANFKNPGA
jgi:calmodulin